MKILITAEMDDVILENIKKQAEVEVKGWQKEFRILSEDEMVEYVKDAEILITSYDEVTKRVIDSARKLKHIICTRANPVNIDIEYAKTKSITVSYTPMRNSDCTAEYTIGMMMSIARKIPQSYYALKSNKFTKENNSSSNIIKDGLKEDITWALSKDTPYVIFKGNQLKNNTLGIIGYGDIGSRVARIASAIGMKVIAYDKNLIKDDGIATFMDLQTLLGESDYISIHVKSSPENKHLIGKKELDKMKKTAYLINTSRGMLIDELALVEALRNKSIKGAALDVFENEPIIKNHPFISELDNIVITPHLAGATYEAIKNHSTMVLEEVENIINDKPLKYLYK